MTTTYTKSLSADFGGNLAPIQLQTEINDGNISSECVCLAVYNFNDMVEIVFDSALSAEDQTTLNSIISEHVADTSVPKEKFFSIVPRENNTTSTTYQRLGGPFNYSGINNIGKINYIEVISYKNESPTSYDVRIYDSTNDKVIAEKTDLTNTDEAINDLGTISNIPEDQALFEVQAKRVGGIGLDKRIYVEEIIVYYNN